MDPSKFFLKYNVRIALAFLALFGLHSNAFGSETLEISQENEGEAVDITEVELSQEKTVDVLEVELSQEKAVDILEAQVSQEKEVDTSPEVPLSLENTSDVILVSEFTAIIFTDSFPNSHIHSVKGIDIGDIDPPDPNQFIQMMGEYLGKPITMNELNNLKLAIIDYYRSHNYPIVGVIIPPGQEITSGVVTIVISEGKLAEITSEGAKYFSNEKIAKQIRTQPGEPINTAKVKRDLEWINQSPFSNTNVIFEPGPNPGETNLRLVTADRYPLRVFAGYENTGNLIAGDSRLIGGFNAGNIFGLGHQLSYVFIAAPNIKEWYGQTATYVAPLPWRHIFEAYGTYTKTKPEDVCNPLHITGKGWQLSPRYNIPFVTKALKHNILLAYEFKRTNNFLNYANNLFFDNYFDISQFLASYEMRADYKIGSTVFGASLYVSPGNMTSFNKDKYFEKEQCGAEANYVYAKFKCDQVFRIVRDFSCIINAVFQQSNRTLLPSEQFSLGGYYTVRGYDENEVISDNGFLFKTEFRSPLLPFPVVKRDRHQIQFLAFADFGYAYDVNQDILCENATILASIGPGLRYNYKDNIVFRFDYGWQLKSIDRRIDDSGIHSRAHLGVFVSF